MIKNIQEYLSSHQRDYITDDFAYSSYNAPNTMYQVSNDLDEVLSECSLSSIKLWHLIMLCVKRNSDPVKAISVTLSHDMFTGKISRNHYYKSLKELVERRLLLTTDIKHVYIVNVQYAHKLYKPKLDI